jgi:hypothetical protein
MAAQGYGALDKMTIIQYGVSSYPSRPAAASVVCWVGPVAPTIGGTGATGRDIWVQTAS